MCAWHIQTNSSSPPHEALVPKFHDLTVQNTSKVRLKHCIVRYRNLFPNPLSPAFRASLENLYLTLMVLNLSASMLVFTLSELEDIYAGVSQNKTEKNVCLNTRQFESANGETITADSGEL